MPSQSYGAMVNTKKQLHPCLSGFFSKPVLDVHIHHGTNNFTEGFASKNPVLMCSAGRNHVAQRCFCGKKWSVIASRSESPKKCGKGFDKKTMSLDVLATFLVGGSGEKT